MVPRRWTHDRLGDAAPGRAEWESAIGRSGRPLDRVIVQVGGGAFASCIGAALRDAGPGGPPILHTVQTEGCAPLHRAWERAADEAGRRSAAARWSSLMWPWETEPHSAADGILDDETYDWLGVFEGMLATGGSPIVAPESDRARSSPTGVRAHVDRRQRHRHRRPGRPAHDSRPGRPGRARRGDLQRPPALIRKHTTGGGACRPAPPVPPTPPARPPTKSRHKGVSRSEIRSPGATKVPCCWPGTATRRHVGLPYIAPAPAARRARTREQT